MRCSSSDPLAFFHRIVLVAYVVALVLLLCIRICRQQSGQAMHDIPIFTAFTRGLEIDKITVFLRYINCYSRQWWRYIFPYDVILRPSRRACLYVVVRRELSISVK